MCWRVFTGYFDGLLYASGMSWVPSCCLTDNVVGAFPSRICYLFNHVWRFLAGL